MADTYEPGNVDENSHGWAPDAPGTGAAKERVIEANKKAFEGRDTQDESRGNAPNPALNAESGESMTRRGEDVVDDEGLDPGRADLGTKGPSQRPYGSSSQETGTGVDPQDTAEPEMQSTQIGQQGH